MEEGNNGCWNCMKAVHVTKGASYVAIICRDRLATDIDDNLQDMSKQTCDKWIRKWRDQDTCPFFHATEYDVNGDRDTTCLYDGCVCDNLGCIKGEGFSEERIKHHIALVKNYEVIVNDERRAKANNMSFDDYMEYRKSLLDKEKEQYRKYLEELKDIENL